MSQPNASERRKRRRQELRQLQWVQRHANALADENGGKFDVEDLDARLSADLKAHPELLHWLGPSPPSPDNDE